MRKEASQDDGYLEKLQEDMPGLNEEVYKALVTYLVWIECPSIDYVASVRMTDEDSVRRQLVMVEHLPSDLLYLFERISAGVESGEEADDNLDLVEVRSIDGEKGMSLNGRQKRARGLEERVAKIKDQMIEMRQSCPGMKNREIAEILGVSEDTVAMVAASLVRSEKGENYRNSSWWEGFERDEEVLQILIEAGRWMTTREVAKRLNQPFSSVMLSIRRLAAEGRLPALPKSSLTEDEEVAIMTMITECRRKKMRTVEIFREVMEGIAIEHEVKLIDLAGLFGVSRERMRQVFNKCEERGLKSLLVVNRRVLNGRK